MNTPHDADRLDSLRDAYEADPDNIAHATELAQYYADRGWYNQAIDIYKKLLSTNADNYALLLDYGNICFRKDDFDEAASVFATLTVIRPKRVEGWNNLGIAQMRLGNFEDARMAFERVLEIEPENPGALLNMGNYSQEKGDFEAAESFFRRAVAARLDFADAWYNLGNLLLGKEDFEGAIEAFDRAIRYFPEFGSAHKNLGVAHERRGDFQKALECYEKALGYNKADPGIYVNFGNVHVAMGDTQKAKQYYMSAVKLAPRVLGGWLGLRDLALSKGDVESYVKATTAILQKLDPELIAESVRTVRRLSHLEKAASILSLADELGKKGDALDAERLVVYQQANKSIAKIGALRERLESLEAPSAEVILSLAEYYHAAGNTEKAILWASRRELETSLAAKRVLWNSLLGNESYDKTEVSIQDYLEQHPDTPECFFYLARVAAARNDESAAKEHLVRALQEGFSDMARIDEDPVLRKMRSESVANHLSRNWENFRTSTPH